MLDAAPIDVDHALASLGLLAAGGTGPAGGWLARRADDEVPSFELVVVAAPDDEGLRDRVERLTRVRHDHLASVHGVTPVGPGRTGVLTAFVRGATLAAVRRARLPLTDGECATVLIPLAEALEALSAAGLAHGAVDAEHVVLQPDGRPVLVVGTPGVLGSVAAHDDLPRLLSTVIGVMPEEDGALLAGPDPVPRLRPVLSSLLRDGCSADEVVDRCFATVAPEAVRLPDAGTLAGTALLFTTGRPFPVSSGATARSLPRPPLPTRRARRLSARRGEPRRRLVGALAAGVVLLAASYLGVQVLAAGAAGDGGSVGAVHDRSDPGGAAAELTMLRARLIAAGDARRLADVAVAGGPSATADAGLMGGLAGQRIEGLTAQVTHVAVVGNATGGSADVSVTSGMSAHTLVAGSTSRTVAPAPLRTVLLHLRWTIDGWRVWSVTDPAAAP